MPMLKKPQSIEQDAFRSQKWDELTREHEFSQKDIPTLTLLVSWYQVVQECIDEISTPSGVQVAYQNDIGDIKAAPQLTTMKQASAEIRAINKQLGIDDTARQTKKQKSGKSVLRLVATEREKKQRAAGQA